MARGRKTGLGKGLDSLIPLGVMEPELEEKAEDDLHNTENKQEVILKLSQIEPNKEQPRKIFDDDSLKELADSISQVGIIQPLIVQKKDDYYSIIAGERRWRAAKLAGLKEVPVIVKQYTDKEVMEISLIENIQRENLNPIEEALAYQQLLDEYSLRHDEVSSRVGKSRTAVTNTLRLLKLDKGVQQLLIEEKISGGHARALLAIEDAEAQLAAALKIAEEQISVRETERLVKKLLSEKKTIPRKEETAVNTIIYQDMENRLKEILGTKVNIKRKTDEQGKIEIEYYSIDELDRIIEILKN